MTTYKDLLAQREALELQIQAARKEELASAIEKVRTLVADYNLTADDIFRKTAPKTDRPKVAPKYRDPATGQTWTGRGKPPQWIAGVAQDQRDQFLINNE